MLSIIHLLHYCREDLVLVALNLPYSSVGNEPLLVPFCTEPTPLYHNSTQYTVTNKRTQPDDMELQPSQDVLIREVF